MNWRSATIAISTCLFFLTTVVYSQDTSGEWELGLNAGAQRFYGDRTAAGFGPGFEGFVTYRILKFADLAFSAGYSVLRYNLAAGGTSTTNLINADIKGNFELLSQGVVRPFISLGLGIVNFKVTSAVGGRFFDASIFGGGGFRFRLNPKIDWLIGADYRFLTGDTIDNSGLQKEGSSGDGYLNIRTGFAYRIAGGKDDYPDVIADQRDLLYEEEGDDLVALDNENIPVDSKRENQNMEEYIKLKSKIDQLSQNLDSQENQVTNLQNQLSGRRQVLTSLEGQTANRRPVRRTRNSSLSGFSDIYEEALTNYYNKNYEEAISLFRVLIDKYPNHTLASNYQYWLGQSLLAQNRYQESIVAFYKVLNFERSFKKDDSLFYLGKTFLKVGSGDSARESFARLIREYPSSEFVEQARNYIQKL